MINAKNAPATIKLWAKAAERLREPSTTSIESTMQQALHHRSITQQKEGLRQYMSIRLGSTELGERALSDLTRAVAEWTTEKLITPPGARAQLYRFARELALSWPAATRGTANGASLPWRDISGQGRTLYSLELAQVRADLDLETREVAELRFARNLAVEEIAFVCGMNEIDVDAAIERARDVTHHHLGTTPQSLIPGVDGALIEAFSLDQAPTSAEQGPFATTKTARLDDGMVLGGRYLIQGCVGTGSFGDVYRAEDEDVPGHIVALKLLHKPALSEVTKAMALRELRHIASVFHPSVVQFKDHGWHDGRLWFVMPWYPGDTLEKRMKKAPLTRAEARDIFEPLARGLAAIHRAGLRHQDIKPDNIFLSKLAKTDEVLPVLIDFGVSAAASELVFAGTPQYFAPEVAAQFGDRGPKRPISGAADVFALALSLRNALEPSTAESVHPSAFDSFIDERARTMPAMPKGKDLKYLEKHFRRWLSLNPFERPTAEEFTEELAILTAPEERRTRRNRTMRWAIPTTLAVGTAFGTTLFVAHQDAELERLRANRAQTEVSLAREDLRVADARGQALEQNLTAAQREIESSQLTRAQLATELAEKRNEVVVLRDDLGHTKLSERALRTDLDTAIANGTALTTALDTTRGELAAENARARAAEAEGTRLRMQLASSEANVMSLRDAEATLSRDLAAARIRTAQLAAEGESQRAEIESQEARMRDLERRIARSESARSELESTNADLRREIERLERAAARPQAEAQTAPSAF
jgi:serine/threonine protein kinase